MKEDLTDIIQRLDVLTKSIDKNTSEIKKLRLKIFGSDKVVPTTAVITHPEILYEYPSMTVTLDAKQWKAVQEGKAITVRGHGYDYSQNLENCESSIDWDYWTFNEGKKGNVQVILMELDSNPPEIDIYSGTLDSCHIVETEVTSKRRAKVL